MKRQQIHIPDLKKKIKPATDKLGTITGVIHGAGVLADKFIEKKTEQDFESVYSTKITGLDSILSSLSSPKLDYLVLFSSSAGFYGNSGQSDYSAANEILNKFARTYKSVYPKSHVVSFNWGPWDGGMVTPQLRKMFEERNIDVIPIDVGARMMSEELFPEHKEVTQLVIGNSMVVPGKFDSELLSKRYFRKISPQKKPAEIQLAQNFEKILCRAYF